MTILFTKSITGCFFILVLSAIFYFGVSGDNSVNDLDKYSATKNVLVLNTTAINKYHHGPQVSASIRMLRDLAATENWRLHEVDNLSKMNKQLLADTDVIVFSYTGGDIFNPHQERIFEEYIRGGGSTVGIHSTTYTEMKNSFFIDLIGGAFAGHPPFQTAELRVHYGDHVSTQHLPPSFRVSDEWYFYNKNPADDPENKVLVSINEASYGHQGLTFGEDKIHPITWSNEKYGGRHWYTSMGHTISTLEQGWFRQHIRGAINWASTKVDTNRQWTSLFDGKSLKGWHLKYTDDEDQRKGFVKVKKNAVLIDTMNDGKQEDIWLISDKEYSNFELRMKVQVDPDSTGNSGIQVRSRLTKKMQGPQIDLDSRNQVRNGLIYDMTQGSERWLYPDLPLNKTKNIKEHVIQTRGHYFVYADEKTAHKTGKTRRQLTPPDKLDFLVTNAIYAHKPAWEIGWNSIIIRCEGTKVTTFINEVLTADYNGEGVLDDVLHQKANVGMKGHIAIQVHGNHKLKMRIKDIELRQL